MKLTDELTPIKPPEALDPEANEGELIYEGTKTPELDEMMAAVLKRVQEEDREKARQILYKILRKVGANAIMTLIHEELPQSQPRAAVVENNLPMFVTTEKRRLAVSKAFTRVLNNLLNQAS